MTRLHNTGIFQNHYHAPIAILILKQNRQYIQEWNITINYNYLDTHYKL